jgi:1-acyl-sn-glycerol-3-phosphate acyltransferase
LFWPRRTFLRFPGTVRVEVLDPIAPGLSREELLARISEVVEAATARLVEMGRDEVRSVGLDVATPADTTARATT